MRLKEKKVLCLILSVFLILIAALIYLPGISEAASDPLADYRDQQEALQQEMEEQESLINQHKSQANAFRSELATLDNKIHRLELDAEAADIQIQVAFNQLEEIKAQLKEAEARLEERTALLQKRVADIYVNGEVSYIDVLLEAESYSDFLMRFDMLEKIVGQDMTLLEQIKADRALIEEQKALQEQRLEDLEVLKQSKLNALASLADIEAEKQDLLVKTEQEKAAAEQAYAEMEKASEEIAEQIRKIQEANRNNGVFNGEFTWPLPGYTYISSDYGMRMHPTLGVYKMHTGIDIPAPKGTNILAAEAGTVITAGYNTAYGYMVIIDHGGGVATLYGHMSSMLVSAGDTVDRGQAIGKVGSTGWSTGNHLHFEVRINGEHVSPWDYLN